MVPARRRRSVLLLGVLGVVLVALALALFGGSRSSPPTTGLQRQPSKGVATPPPPLGTDTQDAQVAPGDGALPSGFAHNPGGAATAATSYISALHGLVLAERGEREKAARAMAARGARGVVDQTLDSLAIFDRVVADARVALPNARVLVRDVPVAYKVNHFDPGRAEVRVWSVGLLLIEGRTEATEVWSTNTVQLAWEEGDWRLSSWSRATGPTPATGVDKPTPPAAVLAAIEGWEGFSYVPSS